MKVKEETWLSLGEWKGICARKWFNGRSQTVLGFDKTITISIQVNGFWINLQSYAQWMRLLLGQDVPLTLRNGVRTVYKPPQWHVKLYLDLHDLQCIKKVSDGLEALYIRRFKTWKRYERSRGRKVWERSIGRTPLYKDKWSSPLSFQHRLLCHFIKMEELVSTPYLSRRWDCFTKKTTFTITCKDHHMWEYEEN
jgi:hypothetical protein